MKAIPAAVLAAFQIDPLTFNAITSSFAATHSGVDGLLDALQVIPPVATGTTYAINLVGATPIPLVTIPVSGTTTTPTTTATFSSVSDPAIIQAANLVTALAEVQIAVGNFNQAMTAAYPGFPAQGTISAILDSSFLAWGMDATQFSTMISTGGIPAGGQIISGGLAAYAGGPWALNATGPGASVTFDANNCVTLLWSYFGGPEGIVDEYFSYKKTITNATGCVGTWKLAGNQSNYSDITIVPLFTKVQAVGGDTFNSGFHLLTSAADTTGNIGQVSGVAAAPTVTAYASITITGPGFATQGNPTATSGTVTLIAPTTAAFVSGNQQNAINDAYYFSSSVLEDCTKLGNWAMATTPCYNSNAVAGSDYVITLFDANNSPLQTFQKRLHMSLGVASVPASWYPTITGVTPVAASGIPTTATTTSVTTTYVLPTGASLGWNGVWLRDSAQTLIYLQEKSFSSRTSNTLSVLGTDIKGTPASGSVNIGAPIGGLKVGTSMGF